MVMGTMLSDFIVMDHIHMPVTGTRMSVVSILDHRNVNCDKRMSDCEVMYHLLVFRLKTTRSRTV